MSYPGLPNGYPPAQHQGTASMASGSAPPPPSSFADSPSNFDIFEWHPAYTSCQRYFLDHAQYDGAVQAVAALINICLPYQWPNHPILTASSTPSQASGSGAYSLPWPPRGPTGSAQRSNPTTHVSLIPFVRRLVVTGFDKVGVLHGFFGDDWRKGVGPLQECERRNYLFAAKSVGWAKVKEQYDMNPHETVPFLRPLQDVQLAEIEGAEKTWSQWLAMEDWMVGPRAPDTMDEGQRNASV
ncbi:hypothetical protein LTS18_000030 [Coniosporium uncinatum]|uniref:Uncharacterized protein n=1 Tax=Coniosporium uncinatum TaxID=93489 RepID=A0ACC3DD85_9PEZI|nr:hypothetical protein LTS18_000030 [Coniosporium uncinatum]